MNLNVVDWLKGNVTCTLNSKHIAIFVNTVIKEKIHIWNIRITGTHQATFTIGLHDFFRLKHILRKTYSRIHVTERNGLPFLLNKFKKRKGIVFGLTFFIMLIYFFSSMIWTISIEGNKNISNQAVVNAINEVGIHQGMLKFKLPSNKQIQEQLQNKLPNTAWIGVKVTGTKLNITIVEKVKPTEEKAKGPVNIVAKKDAVISKIFAEKGMTMVKVNDRVKKGDILISGIIGDVENEKTEAVTAKGVVEGIVWYETRVTIPLKQEWNEYTGNNLIRKYVGLGNRMIKYKGYGDLSYQTYEKKYNFNQVSWKNYHLPIVFITEKIFEYEAKVKTLTKAEALELAKKEAKIDLFKKIDKDSKILSEKVLHQNLDNGKLTLKILYEVLEDIAISQPIQLNN